METKFKASGIISIVALAVLSNLVWILEVLYNGWAGLKWVSIFHHSYYVIFILFIAWLLYISFDLKVKTHPIFYGFIYIGFFALSILLFTVQLSSGPSTLILFSFIMDSMEDLSLLPLLVTIYKFICMILEIGLIILLNSIIYKYETGKNNKHKFITIILPIIAIPVMSIILSFITMLLISTTIINIPYIKYCLEPIHWFKSGSIIFSFVIYECSYIYYVKNIKKGVVHANDAA